MGLPYDLKNTYWVGYDHPYIPTSEVFYSANFAADQYTFISIGIKNMGSPNGYCLVALPENESTYMILYSGSTFSWLYRIPVEFADGDDIANVDLLHFMYSSFGFLGDMQGSYWTWLSSETFEDPDGISGNLEFSVNGTSYSGFHAIDGELTYYPTSGGSITAYDSTNGWASDDYKSFIVTDAWGDDENIQDLLTNYMVAGFLPAPDVIISYKGAEIAAMSDSGTKTLQTQGKYCEGDIVVSYTKPSGGGGGSMCVFTDAPIANANVAIGGTNITPKIAFTSPSLVAGVTVTFNTYSSYIVDAVTGETSGSAIPFTTVARGTYTFTMPNESVYCSLYYDD